MDYETALRKSGSGWRFLILIYFLASFTNLQISTDLTTLTLAMYEPNFTCGVSNASVMHDMDNVTGTSDDKCFMRVLNETDPKVPCHVWTYDKRFLHETIVTEFNLVCDLQYLQKYVFVAFFCGDIIGGVLGWMGDIIGRRKWILICCLWETWTNVAIAFTPNLSFLFACLFLRGLSSGLHLQGLGLLVELVPMKYRDLLCNCFSLFWALGYLQGTCISYYVQSWRIAKLMSVIPSVLYLVYLCYLPESPHWLILKGKKDEAVTVFKKMSRINRQKLADALTKEQIACEQSATGRLKDLFLLPNARFKTLIMCFALWAMEAAYYGLTIDPTFFSANIFLAMGLQGFIEIPALFLTVVMAEKLGKRVSSIMASLATSVCILIVPFLANVQCTWLQLGVALSGKAFLVIGHDLLDVINTEIFPSSVRSLGINFTNIFATSAAVLAPYINSLQVTSSYASSSIFGLSIAISTVFICLLPETGKRPLAKTTDEAESLMPGNEDEWSKLMQQDANNFGTML